MAEKTSDAAGGYNAAHLAGLNGHVEAVRVLQELGCPVAEKSNAGHTAAHLAAEAGHVEALHALKALA